MWAPGGGENEQAVCGYTAEKQSARRLVTGVASSLLLLAGMLLLVGVSRPDIGHATQAARASTPVPTANPTPDPTQTALEQLKLREEIVQLQRGNERGLRTWLWANSSTILTTLAVVATGLFGLYRFLDERRRERQSRDEERQRERQSRDDEREKRAEERFQGVVDRIGSEQRAIQAGAAITLRTFLRDSYKQYHKQVFNLTVSNLQLSPYSAKVSGAPPDALDQALTVAFREAYPLARAQCQKPDQELSAAGIKLDRAYLKGAQLDEVWMPDASLIQAVLVYGHLNRANLAGAQLMQADLSHAELENVTLVGADLTHANLEIAQLNKARLEQATLIAADLTGADLSGAILEAALCTGAILDGAVLTGANCTNCKLEDARSLKGVDLTKVTGLSGSQLHECQIKGAII